MAFGRARYRGVVGLCVLTAVFAGCPFSGDDDDDDDGTSSAERGTNLDSSCRQIGIVNNPVEKVDLLFVVDNSGSMREEQAALRAQFPTLLARLTDPSEGNHAVARDVHFGVVSSDMGLVNVQGIPGCEGLGDDGVLRSAGASSVEGCDGTYPPFLSFVGGTTDAAVVATDLGCIATLGTDGCGFEQQLEASLKALWPAIDRGGNGAMDPNGAVADPNRIQFLSDATTRTGLTGHGDGANAGFLRNDPASGPSVIAVVIVTDEEDCSSFDNSHLIPPQFLNPDEPLAMQDLNLRCFHNKQNLYQAERYVEGLRALRPDAPSLVIFGVVAGVPPDLVDADALADVDFFIEASREAHYETILNDERMKETVDPARMPGEGSLLPSCELDANDDGTIDSRAYPPRRLVEVARGFGESGFVSSICQTDFSDMTDKLVERIARQLDAPCLPRKLVRDDTGKVGCELHWELPKPGTAPASSPTSCDQLPFLESAGKTRDGEARCRVKQLAVQDDAAAQGDGWFYDDFSDVTASCMVLKQRIAYSEGAEPPPGVVAFMSCCD